MTELSPRAQSVLDATDYPEDWATRIRVAAALRAAADQVVPEEIDLPPVAPDLRHFRQHERRLTRRQLLAIAAEVEGTNPTSEGV